LVYPVLKSSPTTKTPFSVANSITPSTNVFYGLPLIKLDPSKIVANAKTVDGEISVWLSASPFIKFAAVS